jgi:hypothetical protein
MAYDEGLAERLRPCYKDIFDIDERRMFGGLAILVNGHMSCGIVGETLMVRVGPEQYIEALNLEHTREMDFTGKPLRGFIYVAPPGFEEDIDLQNWVNLSLDFVYSLPPKNK